MTWDPTTSCGFESAKIASIAVPYLQGRGLDIGCGMSRVWPSAIGVDNGHHFGSHSDAAVTGDGSDLGMFADGSLDYVFSSHLLEHFEPSKLPSILCEWWRVLRAGGRLVLYLPHADFYPRCGEEGANPDHKADYRPADIIERMRAVGFWTLLENEERNGSNEYSFFQVYRKEVEGHAEALWQRNPDGRKRALVIRYGAIGDQVVAASALPGLKAQGYHVTYNTTPDAQQIVLHDPHIDEFLIQERDFVPNQQLGPYWASLAERYDLIINLCESIEGALLKLAGRLDHGYSDEARRRLVGHVNYLERTHDIAGVPHKFSARFYPTEAEMRLARAIRVRMNGPVVAWAIHGSSLHKIYPFTQVVVRWLLDNTPAHVILLGDGKAGRELQTGILATLGDLGDAAHRLHANAGLWDIRKVLSFVQCADVVVGPETGILNAVCMEAMAKVVYLSHSSRENLTKHWRNTTALEPPRDACPCFPCHRLHQDGTFCHKVEETQAALCASSIPPERVFEAIALSIGAKRKAA